MTKVRLAIFEDEQDLLELFQELLSPDAFEVLGYTDYDQVVWGQLDILVGDYNNSLVPFSKLREASQAYNLPLIAISGGDMEHPHQLTKPFDIEELEAMVFRLLNESKSSNSSDETQGSPIQRFKLAS